jgi:hypothetical protein
MAVAAETAYFQTDQDQWELADLADSGQYDRYTRIYNDATTWLAETLDGSMRTPFEYSFDGHELYADDGSAMGPIFDDAIAEARRLVARDPSMAFELRRRIIERGEYEDMLAMMRGEAPNTMVVESDFPPELMLETKHVGGYNVDRKQTMMRVITKRGDRLYMQTQTLDGSDRVALEAIYGHFGRTPGMGELLGQRIHEELTEEEQDYLADRLTGIYDRSLQERTGESYYAGRRESKGDTYKFVLSQHELVGKFVSHELNGGINAADRYNIAALIAKRYEEFKSPHIEIEPEKVVKGAIVHDIERQLQLAGDEARAAGRQFSACGISASSGEKSAAQQLNDAGYGNLSSIEEDTLGSLTFKCTNGHFNTRPIGKKIKQCRVTGCVDSVGC